jgi:anaerobic glycerol-3-phosphate dehydrogenase
MITNRYFDLDRGQERFVAREYENIMGGKISKYDDIIKKIRYYTGVGLATINSTDLQRIKIQPQYKVLARGTWFNAGYAANRQ